MKACAWALGVALALAGCGGLRAPDLFVIERSGTVAGGSLTLLVNEEGGVRCNGGVMLKLSDSELVEARGIQEDLRDATSKHLHLPPGPRPVLAYHLRQETGSVTFSDDSPRQPGVLHRLASFMLHAAQRVCHLPL